MAKLKRENGHMVPRPTLPGLRVEPMPPHLEPDVREIYGICHPGWPALPEPHFFATPTLVAIAPYPGNVVGFASYALNLTDQGHTQIWLKDTCVLPEYRGKGIATALMRARLKIGEQMGADVALGMTQPGNDAMLKILQGQSFERRQVIKDAYPDADGIFFGRRLG